MLLSGINGCVYKRESAEMLLMCGYPDVRTMSIAAIQKLNDAGIKCTTLTKGILPIELAHFSPENEHGITLKTTARRWNQVRRHTLNVYLC